MKDGKYTIEVTLKGGSGKSSIESPTELEVENGVMTAEIVWNSKNYTYMEINGEKYLPESNEENSTFLVEIPSLDTDIEFIAETVAMSKPKQIEYSMRFDSSTAKSEGTFPILAVAAGAVLLVAGVIAVLAFKKKRKKNEND